MPFPSNSNIITSSGQISNDAVSTNDIQNDAVTPDKLGEGNDGEVLMMVSGEPAWTAPSSIPTGLILPYAGSSAPTGYLFADGSTISQATYAALYAVIGHTYGADPGGGNFILPNLKGRVPVGKSTDIEFDTLGETGGAKTHTLTESEIPAHNHNISLVGNTIADNGNYITPRPAAGSASGNKLTDNTGGGGAHNNLQPYITLNYIIKT